MAERGSALHLAALAAAALTLIAGVGCGGAWLITRAASERAFRTEEAAYAAGQPQRGGLAKQVLAGLPDATSASLASSIASAIHSPGHIEAASLGQAAPRSLLRARADVLTMADISAWYAGAADGSWFTVGRIMPFTASAGWNNPRMALVLGSGAVLLGLVTFDAATGSRKVALLYAYSAKRNPGPGELMFQYVHSIPGVPGESLFVPAGAMTIPYARVGGQVASALRRAELQSAQAS